jgi:polyhydroxybutyrate depolymerase
MRRLALMLALLLLVAVSIPRMMGAALIAELTPAVTDFNDLLQPGRHLVTLRVDDYQRRFIFITPKAFQPGTPLPLVFFFHGAGGSAPQAAHTYGWVEKADVENFFVAFPEGLPVFVDSPASFLLNPRIWRDGQSELRSASVNDIHYFEVLLARIQAKLPIDPKRIYLTGFSNGAGMTFTLGSHESARIAAIAPVSSQSLIHIPSLARALPVFYLTGTADPLVPYHGGTVALPWGTTRSTPPIQESVDTWAKLDGCPPEPQMVSDEKGVRVLHYGPGRDESEVLFTTIEGNGHHWPTSVEPLPRAISGPTLDPINATDQIWDFFWKHPLK